MKSETEVRMMLDRKIRAFVRHANSGRDTYADMYYEQIRVIQSILNMSDKELEERVEIANKAERGAA